LRASEAWVLGSGDEEIALPLHPKGIDHVSDVSIVHTIGYAYWILSDSAPARQAADRILHLIVASEPAPEEERIGRLVRDIK